MKKLNFDQVVWKEFTLLDPNISDEEIAKRLGFTHDYHPDLSSFDCNTTMAAMRLSKSRLVIRDDYLSSGLAINLAKFANENNS